MTLFPPTRYWVIVKDRFGEYIAATLLHSGTAMLTELALIGRGVDAKNIHRKCSRFKPWGIPYDDHKRRVKEAWQQDAAQMPMPMKGQGDYG